MKKQNGSVLLEYGIALVISLVASVYFASVMFKVGTEYLQAKDIKQNTEAINVAAYTTYSEGIGVSKCLTSPQISLSTLVGNGTLPNNPSDALKTYTVAYGFSTSNPTNTPRPVRIDVTVRGNNLNNIMGYLEVTTHTANTYIFSYPLVMKAFNPNDWNNALCQP